MKSFLVILQGKCKGELTNDLLVSHVEHLKKLKQQGYIQVCGPMVDNDGAMLVFRADSKEQVEEFVTSDPFISEGYYQSYDIQEFIEANDENNWLMANEQTLGNLR